MNQHKFERLDKGIQRQQFKAPDVQPRQEKGQFLPVVSIEQRGIIINDALERLESGETTDQIGESYNIDGSTLRRWLLADDRADKARCVYFAGELMKAKNDIVTADSPFTLARAREDFRATSWLAERRLSHLYGPKQEITTNVAPILNISIVAAPQQMVDIAQEVRTIDVKP